MNIESFYEAITKRLEKSSANELISSTKQHFIDQLKSVYFDTSSDQYLKMTRMTILFEGFYHSLLTESDLRQDFLDLRFERWKNHFGTPTVTFLLSYKLQIEQTSKYFNDKEAQSIVMKPWAINITKRSKPDESNNLLIDSRIISEVIVPEEEKTGQFVKTHNPSGGFTTTPCDPYSQKFIEFAETIAINGGRALEIGAAFGAASLQALAKGATVYCNDIEPENLAVIRNRYLQNQNDSQGSLTGDHSKLVLVPGSFPEELAMLPHASFDAILICRVLHFFSGKNIEKSLEQLSKFLKPGGKLFIVCETPYLKNWQSFIPEHEKRVAQGVEWPGEITNPSHFESSGRAASLPQFVHWITKEILDRSLIKSNLDIITSSYINRHGQFPKDLLLDGRESVGAVAEKRIRCRL